MRLLFGQRYRALSPVTSKLIRAFRRGDPTGFGPEIIAQECTILERISATIRPPVKSLLRSAQRLKVCVPE